MMQTKDFKFTMVEQVSDEGKFTGYASVFGGVDSYGDTVEKGAFKKTLKENESFPMLWSHNTDEPIGIIRGKEDSKGLFIHGELNLDVASAREKRSLMKQGAITGTSIGYEAAKWEFDTVEKVRHLKEIKLWEVSPVVFPADSNARIAQIKGIPYTDSLGLMEFINSFDIKELEPRFHEVAKKAADRIYALLSNQPKGEQEPQLVDKPDMSHLFAALENFKNLTGGK
jgi:HK97 family phage prohead protease